MEPLLSQHKESLTPGLLLLQLSVPGLILSFPQNNWKGRARGAESGWELVWESLVVFGCRGNKMIKNWVKWLKAKGDEESQSPWFAWGVEGADLSQICLRENGDRDECEVSVVQMRNNSLFVESGKGRLNSWVHYWCQSLSKCKETTGFPQHPAIPFHSFILPQQLFLFTAAAQLVLNFLENISPNTHGLCSVTDRELFSWLRTVTFGPNLLKRQNHNSKKPLWKTKAIFGHLEWQLMASAFKM